MIQTASQPNSSNFPSEHVAAEGEYFIHGELTKALELIEFFDWAKTKNKFIVATTCDCHGVVNAYQKQQSNTKK